MTADAKVFEVINDRILAALNDGVVPWRKPWAGSAMAPRNIRGRRYSGINAFYLSMLGFTDPRFLTFKQAQALGGRVRKGEKGYPVVFWKFLSLRVPHPDEPAEENVTLEKRVPMLRYYTVFNVSQVDGLNLKPIDTTLPEGANPDARAEAILMGYLDREGAPSFDHKGGDKAYYVPAEDAIHLPDRAAFYTTEGYYETTFHEVGHSTGHPTRLNRDHHGHFGSEQYGREELVAEFTAAFLMGEAGLADMTTIKNMAAYIDSWKRAIADDPRMLVVAAGRAEKAARLVLGDTLNDEEEEETTQQEAA